MITNVKGGMSPRYYQPGLEHAAKGRRRAPGVEAYGKWSSQEFRIQVVGTVN